MHRSFIISVFSLFGLLVGVCLGQEKEEFLSFPELRDKVVVSLPEGYNAKKRYPVVFYYHGMGGQPDTTLMRLHTGKKDWIVVGMGYVKEGRTDLSKAAFAKEMLVFKKVKKLVVDKYGGNIRACYVAGFSKGGWLADAMLQTQPSLAGGVILGAGKMVQFNQIKTYSRGNGVERKEVFIGIGEKDMNYTYAYHSFMMHRKMGASVSLEIWRGVEHEIPEKGSIGLKQWLELRANQTGEVNKLAEQEIKEHFDEAGKLPEHEQYFALRDLSKTPYVKLLGEGWKKRILARIEGLKKNQKVKEEALAYSLKQRSLFNELQYRNSADLEKVRKGYLSIIDSYPQSAEAALVSRDVHRVDSLLKRVKLREDEIKSKQRQTDKDKAAEVDDLTESDKDRIPRNPFDR